VEVVQFELLFAWLLSVYYYVFLYLWPPQFTNSPSSKIVQLSVLMFIALAIGTYLDCPAGALRPEYSANTKTRP
jgi:hypothetical protein